MARRSSWRIPIHMNVKFHSGGRLYSGIVKNISEDGMFISIENSIVPSDSDIKIFISYERGTLDLTARLVRSVQTEGFYKGIGVELINPPAGYLYYVENLLYTL